MRLHCFGKKHKQRPGSIHRNQTNADRIHPWVISAYCHGRLPVTRSGAHHPTRALYTSGNIDGCTGGKKMRKHRRRKHLFLVQMCGRERGWHERRAISPQPLIGRRCTGRSMIRYTCFVVIRGSISFSRNKLPVKARRSGFCGTTPLVGRRVKFSTRLGMRRRHKRYTVQC